MLPTTYATNYLCYQLPMLPTTNATNCLCYRLPMLPTTYATNYQCYQLPRLPTTYATNYQLPTYFATNAFVALKPQTSDQWCHVLKCVKSVPRDTRVTISITPKRRTLCGISINYYGVHRTLVYSHL